MAHFGRKVDVDYVRERVRLSQRVKPAMGPKTLVIHCGSSTGFDSSPRYMNSCSETMMCTPLLLPSSLQDSSQDGGTGGPDRQPGTWDPRQARTH